MHHDAHAYGVFHDYASDFQWSFEVGLACRDMLVEFMGEQGMGGWDAYVWLLLIARLSDPNEFAEALFTEHGIPRMVTRAGLQYIHYAGS